VSRLFQLKGSIFPPALAIALPCGLLSSVLKIGQNKGWFAMVDNLNLLNSPAAWTAFSALLGFLVVFRTSQAYTRFWAGCSATHAMRLDWFNACTMLVAYCRISKAPEDRVNAFMGRLTRLISIMHAAALAELEEINVDTEKVRDITALRHNVLDPTGLDESSRYTLAESSCKVELVFTWIQMLIVESVDAGVISPPPPVLSSVWNVFVKGMDSFGDALRISFIPFPFPYVQTCDMLLVLHWLMTPMVVLAWVEYYSWSGLLTFLQVFIVQALNLIAVEIENPFGIDANDLDSAGMQEEMNGYLTLFSKHDLRDCPRLTGTARCEFDLHLKESQQPLLSAFDSLDVELAESDRKGRDFSRARIREKQTRGSMPGRLTRQKSSVSLVPGESSTRSMKRRVTRQNTFRHKSEPEGQHDSEQLHHQFVKPDAQDQLMEQPSLQAMPPPMPIQEVSCTSAPPPPPPARSHQAPDCSSSKASCLQAPLEEGGHDLPEQPHHDVANPSTAFKFPRVGQPSNGEALVMCTPEEDDISREGTDPRAKARWHWHEKYHQPVEAAIPTQSPCHLQHRDRPCSSFSLGWDPPAPAAYSRETSGPLTSVGGGEHQGSLSDLEAVGVIWRR